MFRMRYVDRSGKKNGPALLARVVCIRIAGIRIAVRLLHPRFRRFPW